MKQQITKKMEELSQAIENESDKSNKFCNELIWQIDKKCKAVK